MISGDFKWFLTYAKAIKMFENLKYAIYFINYIVWWIFWYITFKNHHSTFCTMANTISHWFKLIQIEMSLKDTVVWILFTTLAKEYDLESTIYRDSYEPLILKLAYYF